MARSTSRILASRRDRNPSGDAQRAQERAKVTKRRDTSDDDKRAQERSKVTYRNTGSAMRRGQ